jgi:hypothetical protein
LGALRYNVIQWLCVRDQTYSQLCRALSAIPLDHQNLSDTLENVARFHQPKVQEQGYYQLKPELWKEFDPLFAHFYLSELEEAQVCRFTVVSTSCRLYDGMFGWWR